MTTPICTIDLYATKDFISQERKQITEQTRQPLSVKKTYKFGIEHRKGEKTKIPYPPNLSMTPASNIDPVSEASTCAFGNHKCKLYIGSFAIKAEVNKRPEK